MSSGGTASAGGSSPTTGGHAFEQAGAGGETIANGGIASGGGTASSGGQVSTGGTGGAPASGPPPALLGSACDVEDERACTPASLTMVLRCKDGSWRAEDTCLGNERCDLETASCLGLDPLCLKYASNGPTCVQDEAFDCGPNVRKSVHLTCPLGCEAGACVAPSGDQLLLHTDFSVKQGVFWPQSIPVCFSEAASAWSALVRDEVETTWQRPLNLNFVGWTSCDEASAGVRVTFDEDCSGSLVNAATVRYPGDGEYSAVRLCLSTRGEAGERKPLPENVVRLLARHQFGHVLGLDDAQPAQDTMMLRTTRTSEVDTLRPTLEDFVGEHSVETTTEKTLLYAYSRKPEDRVVNVNGDCLSVVDGAPAWESCLASSVEMFWEPAASGLRHLEASAARCLHASSADTGSALELKACALAPNAAAQNWTVSHAQWRAQDYCAAVFGSAKPGAAVITEPCGPIGQPSQSWFFELLSKGRAGQDNFKYTARIHLSDSEYCVIVPGALEADLPVQLQPCASIPIEQSSFKLLADGSIWYSNFQVYFDRPGSVLYMQQYGMRRYWVLTGALEGIGEFSKKALTRTPAGGLVVAPLGPSPTREQEFDVYF